MPDLHKECPICLSNKIKILNGHEQNSLSVCDCGFVFMTEIPSQETLTRYYSRYGFSEDIYISPITIDRYNDLVSTFERHRRLNRILDDGCGGGFFLDVAREGNWNVFGTEFSESSIKKCNQRGLNVFDARLGYNHFKSESFDVITSFEVIEHLTFPVDRVKSLCKLLRSGGLLHITTPNFSSISRKLLGTKWSIINYPEHLSYFTRKTLTNCLVNEGFKIVKVETTGISLSRWHQSRGEEIMIQNENSPDERLRSRIEKVGLLRLAKEIINRGLSVISSGDTLKIWAVKS